MQLKAMDLTSGSTATLIKKVILFSLPLMLVEATLILYTCYTVSWIASLTCQMIYYFVERKKIYREIENNKIAFQNAQ